MKKATQPIAPPFPFPHRWTQVLLIQQMHFEKFWSVPQYPTDYSSENVVEVPSSSSGFDDGHALTHIIEEADYQYQVEDEGEEQVVLEMNPVWAERFAATLDRMRKKRQHDNNQNDQSDVNSNKKNSSSSKSKNRKRRRKH